MCSPPRFLPALTLPAIAASARRWYGAGIVFKRASSVLTASLPRIDTRRSTGSMSGMAVSWRSKICPTSISLYSLVITANAVLSSEHPWTLSRILSPTRMASIVSAYTNAGVLVGRAPYLNCSAQAFSPQPWSALKALSPSTYSGNGTFTSSPPRRARMTTSRRYDV